MRILLLSKYDSLGASSRLRFLQYLPSMQDQGWTIDPSPLFSNTYLQALYQGKPRLLEVLKGYLRRLSILLHANRYDLILLEKELFPFLPAWFERILSWENIPYVVDYDDAQFHRYDQNRNPLVRILLGKKIDVVMQHAALVITGNSYLADRAAAAGAHHIDIIPTVVDTALYQPAPHPKEEPLIVGWIGTPKTSDYLRPLLPVFEKIHRELGTRFVAVGAQQSDFDGTVVEVWPWTQQTEVNLVQRFDIGIMPLNDTPWERGKCGYKLIQCMACAVPVIASPVGVNTEIIEDGVNGYLASSPDEWAAQLRSLLADPNTRQQLGQSGREKIIQSYSLQAHAPRLLQLLHRAGTLL